MEIKNSRISISSYGRLIQDTLWEQLEIYAKRCLNLLECIEDVKRKGKIKWPVRRKTLITEPGI